MFCQLTSLLPITSVNKHAMGWFQNSWWGSWNLSTTNKEFLLYLIYFTGILSCLYYCREIFRSLILLSTAGIILVLLIYFYFHSLTSISSLRPIFVSPCVCVFCHPLVAAVSPSCFSCPYSNFFSCAHLNDLLCDHSFHLFWLRRFRRSDQSRDGISSTFGGDF